MAATYVPIQTYTLAATAGIVTFSSIPQTYTDLVLIQQARVSSTYDITAIRVNSVTTGYSRTYLQANSTGSGTTSGRGTAEIAFRGGYVPGTSYSGEWSMEQYDFLNYTNSSYYKTALAETVFTGSSLNFNIQKQVAYLNTTGAITQITTQPVNGANWAIGSTFTLYGIKAA